MAIDLTPAPGPFEITSILARPIAPDEEPEWDRLMEEVHPLGNARFAGHRVKYVAEMRGHAVALLCISGCAYHLADRDRHIGWSVEQAMQRRHLVVQNSRFLILSKKKRKNVASRVLSVCTRRIQSDWLRLFGYRPLMVETFVDPVHFRGTCYKAAGWEQVGSTRGFRRDGREFYSKDSHAKQIWIKSLDAKAGEWLRSERMPEPWRSYETPLRSTRVADRLGVKGLHSLFRRLQDIPDFRRTNGRRYPVACCLAIVTCAYLAGCSSIEECAEFAAGLTQPQLGALRSWRNPKTNRYEAPRATTLWRVVSGIDAELFEEKISSWATDTDMSLEAISIDGKAIRATRENEDGGSFVVSAFSHSGSSPFFSRSLPMAKDRSQPLRTDCSNAWATSAEQS